MFGKPTPLEESQALEIKWLRGQLEEAQKSLLALTNPAIYLARYGRATKAPEPAKEPVTTVEIKAPKPDPRGPFMPQHTREQIEKQFAGDN